jgi:hypothetical protein
MLSIHLENNYPFVNSIANTAIYGALTTSIAVFVWDFLLTSRQACSALEMVEFSWNAEPFSEKFSLSQCKALKLFAKFAKSSQAIVLPDIKARKSAFDGFREIVKEGHPVEEIIQATSKAIFDPLTFSSDSLTRSPDNQDIRSAISDLFNEIFQRGKGFEEAVQIASQAIYSESDEVQCIAVDLLTMLTEKDKCVEKIIQIASKLIYSEKSMTQSTALNLFDMLFQKGKGFEEAIQIVSELSKDPKDPFKEYTIKRLNDLMQSKN